MADNPYLDEHYVVDLNAHAKDWVQRCAEIGATNSAKFGRTPTTSGTSKQGLSLDIAGEKGEAIRVNIQQSGCEIPANSVDLVTMDLSIDYMTKPVSLFKSAYALLKHRDINGADPRQGAGVLCVSFSNRYFPQKVVKGWMTLTCAQRGRYVAALMHYAGFPHVEVHDMPHPGGRKDGGDPLSVVVGRTRALCRPGEEAALYGLARGAAGDAATSRGVMVGPNEWGPDDLAKCVLREPRA